MQSQLKSLSRRGRVICLALAVPLLGACAVEPWVKPYERQLLADPIMSFERDAIAASYSLHVQEAREGARGAERSGGGGCGCN